MDSAKGAIAEWAAREPRIRRAWLLDDNEVAVELQPVADSEETLAIWLYKADKWRAQLLERVGPGVRLEWLDPDRDEAILGEDLARAKTLIYERGG